MRVCVLMSACAMEDAGARQEVGCLATAGHEVFVLERRPLYRLLGSAGFVLMQRDLRPEVIRAHGPGTLVLDALLARLTGARLICDSLPLRPTASRRRRSWEDLVRRRAISWTTDPSPLVEGRRVLALYARLENDARQRVRNAYRDYAVDQRKGRAWDAANAGNSIMRAEVLERILQETTVQRAAAAEVLDIGCGAGWWLLQLARADVSPQRLHGVDLIAERVERARGLVPAAQVDVADATALPFEAGRFGIVLLLTTLSSAGGPARRRALLLEARRVLAPGGVLIVYEPRWPNPGNRHTNRIARRELRPCEGDLVWHEPITVLPLIARRLGERVRPLTRLRVLRSHRLTIIRGSS